MKKTGENSNYNMKYRFITMILAVTMVFVSTLPAGAFGINAVAGADNAGNPMYSAQADGNGNPADPAANDKGGQDRAEADGGAAGIPGRAESPDPDGAADLDVTDIDVPDFGSVFGAPADDNLRMKPMPDVSVGSSDEENMEKPPEEAPTYALGDALVSDWAGLRAAIGDPAVSKITFANDITRSDANYLGFITRNLEIDGAGFTLNNKQGGTSATNQSVFFLGAGANATLKVKNMAVIDGATGGTTGQSFIGTQYLTSNTTTYYPPNREAAHGDNSKNWKIEIEDVWQSQANPSTPVMFPGTVSCGMIAACDAAVTFSGRVSWSVNSDTRVVNARDLTFTGSCVADFAAAGNAANSSNATLWLYSSATARPDNLTVKDGAQVDVYSQKSQAIIVGDMVDTTTTTVSTAYPVANVNITGDKTRLYCYGDGNFATQRNNVANPGIVDFKGGTGTVNITGGAQFIVDSRNKSNGMTGISIQLPVSTTNIKDKGSLLKVTANSSGAYGAGMLFRYVGGQTFNISEEGRAEVIFWPHSGGASTAALRFGAGANNSFVCRKGGSVYIYNGGNGTAASGGGGDAYGNKAVEYVSDNFTFDVQGHKSAVEIVSDNGFGIGASTHTNGVISCKDEAIFSVTGKTNSATGADSAIFRAGSNLKITVDNPLYFDFTNTRSGGGQVTSVSGTPQSFIATQTRLSVWRRGKENWNATPWKSWIEGSLNLSGTDLATVNSGDPVDLRNTFASTAMTNYTRLSGNNARAQVGRILPITNADRYIRALAEVPEGFAQLGRPAFTDEVSCVFKITPADGSKPYTVKATSIEYEDVYGEYKQGVLRYPLPNYLTPGDKIEVVDAWIGPSTAKDPGSVDKYNQSNPEDITATAVKVTDQSPPLSGTVTTQKFYANQNKIEGTWDLDAVFNEEPPVKLYAYDDGKLITDGGVAVQGIITGSGSNGTWTYYVPSSYQLTAGHTLQFALEDGNGNQVFLATTMYHDRLFNAAPGLEVLPVLYNITSSNVCIGTDQAIKLDTSMPITFINMNDVKGFDLSKPTGQQATAVSVDASNWTNEWETWDGYPPFKSKTYEITYSIAADPTYKHKAQITVVNAAKVGPEYGIGAKKIDYITPAKAQAITDAELIAIAKAFAFKVIDGSPGTIEVESRNFPANGVTEGTGTVTFRVGEEQTTTITVDVVVSKKNAPVLTVTNPYFIAQPTLVQDNSVYMTSVSAIDAEDGNITKNVTYTGVVDTTKQGVYTVNYSVFDKDGNESTATRIVWVGYGPPAQYIIQAKSFSITSAAVTENPISARDAQIRSFADVKVIDAATGKAAANMTPTVSIVGSPAYGQLAAGETYRAVNISLSMANANNAGLIAFITPNGTPISDWSIVLANYTATISMAEAGAWDDAAAIAKTGAKGLHFDGTTFKEVPLTVTSNPVKAAIGNYPVVFAITSNPQTTETATISVAGGNFPVIDIKPNPEFVSKGSFYDYMNGVSATDLEDDAKGITLKVTHAGTVDTGTPGRYTVTYSVTDSDRNTTTATRTVYVNGKQIGPFILVAQDFSIADSAVTESPAKDRDDQIIAKSLAQVYDMAGNITTGAIIEVKDDGGYRRLTAADPGPYKDFPVSLGLKGYNGPTEKLAVNARVVKGLVGKTFTIAANDFTATRSEALKADSAKLIALAKAQAWKNSDWTVKGTVTVVSSGIPANPVMGQSYPIVLETIEDPSATVTVYCTIANVNAPRINFNTPIEISAGAAFDPKQGVTAEDDIDLDITSQVQIVSNTVNTSAAGIYKVVYGVTNSNNVYTERTRVVVVNDGTFSVGAKYIIKASSFVIRTSDVIENPPADKSNQIMAQGSVKAYSGITGDEVTAIVLDDGGYRSLGNGENEKDFIIKVQAYDDRTTTPANGQAIRSIKAKVVRKDVLTIANGYAIAGNNYKINPTEETGIDDAQLLSRASADAWKLDDNLTSVTPKYESYDGTRMGKTGVYQLAMSVAGVANSPTAKVNVNVTQGGVPVLAVSSPAIVNLGDSFDFNAGVSASDAEDDLNNIPLTITHTGTVDTGKAGIYTVKYSVTDSDHNTVDATRVVIVQDGSVIIGNSYILQVRNFVILKSSVTATDNEILSKSMANAWVKATGAPANNLLKVVNDGGYKQNAKSVAQDYSITIGVDGDAAAQKNITGRVIDKQIIGGNEYYIITADDVSLPQSQAQSQLSPLSNLLNVANVQAIRLSDMSNTPARLGANNVNTGKVGSYTAEYVVAADNSVSVQGKVDVTMGNPPTLSLKPNPDVVTVGSISAYDYMNGVTADDADDGDITGKVTWSGKVDTNTPGVYAVTYTVTDSDGNADSQVRTVVVQDGTFLTSNTYILRARSFVIQGNKVNNSGLAAQILSQSMAKAWDVKTGREVPAMVYSPGGYCSTPGVYDVIIAVDADRTITRAIKAAVVSDALVVDAGDYWIVGNPIKINSTEDKAVPAPDFVKLGKVQAFKADDKLTKGTPVLESYTGNYDGTQGSFKASFAVAENPASKLKDLDVVVTDGKRPLLTVNPVVVNVAGGAVLTQNDYMNGVSATDDEDDHAGKPLKITFSGNVDTNVKGIYKVTYSVTDSDYNKVSAVRYYAVGGKFIQVGPYFLYAEDYSIDSANVVAAPALSRDGQIISASKAEVFDSNMQPATGVNILVADAGGYRQLAANEGAKVFDIKLELDKVPGQSVPIKALVGNNLVQGSSYSISAGDFSISVADAKAISDAKLIAWAQAKAFRNDDFSNAAVLVESHNIKAAQGSYTVTFQVANEPATKTTVKVNISSVAPPVIKLSSPAEIPVGASFNPLQGVSAQQFPFDAIDPACNITSNIKVTNSNVDTSKGGVYQVDYQVQDDFGNTATASKVVVVNDGTYEVGSHYILKARSFVLRKADVDAADPHGQILLKGGVMAWDGLTGNAVSAEILNDGGYYVDNGADLQTFAIRIGVAADAATMPASGRAIRNITAMVVNKNYVVTGQNYIIAADNVKINRTDEKGITNAQLLSKANAEAWKLDAGLSKATPEVFQYLGYRNGTAGVYDLTFDVVQEPATKVTVQVNVTDGKAPDLLVAPALVSLKQGDRVDYMDGVSATDSEDGDITGKVTCTGTVDNNKAGVYPVTYSVTDSDHNTVTATRIYTVGNMVVGNNYIVDAGNFVALLKNVSGGDAEILSLSGARAWDRLTGAPANKVLEVRDNGGYAKAEGEYDITIGAKGDRPAEKAVKGKVIDLDNIVISDTYIIAVKDVTKTISVAQSQYSEKQLILWADAHAWLVSDLSETTVEVGANNINKNLPGLYNADYQVAADKSVKVNGKFAVTKGDAPVLSLKPNPDTVKAGSGAYNYMNGVTATDTEDDKAGVPVTVTYSGKVDTTKAGVYTVTYTATDSDGNTDQAVRIVAVDDGSIVIGPNYIIKANSFVIKGVDVAGSASQRLAQLIAKTGAQAWVTSTGAPADVVVMSDDGYSSAQNIYKVLIAADKDRNTNITVSAAVVNASFVVDTPDYFIVGNSIKMNSTVDKSQPDLVSLGNVKAYEKNVSLTPAKVSLESYTGKFDGTAGNFSATFHVDADQASKLSNVPVQVTDGQKPVFGPMAPISISIGGKVDFMQGVSASDNEDGDLTATVTWTSNVDTSKKGVYNATYSVTDSDYNTVTAQRIVAVGMVMGDKYILDAGDFMILAKNVTESPSSAKDAQIISASMAQAYDFSGAPVYPGIRVVSDGGYSKADGLYNISLDVQGDPKAKAQVSARVVDAGAIITGKDYDLVFSDFTISVSDAKAATNDKLIVWAKAKAYDKNNGYAPASKVTVESSGLQPKQGAYNIVFSVTEDSSIRGTSIGTVTAGNAPTLNVSTPAEIRVGSAYDPLKNVTAYDYEDGDLSSAVKVTSTVDVNAAGVYTDTYTVTDKDGNTAMMKRVVVVNDGTLIVGAKYVVQAHSFVIRKVDATMTGSNDQIIDRGEVKAWSAITGDPATPIVLNNGGYYDGVGTTFSISVGVAADAATTPASDKAIRNITAEVVDADLLIPVDDYLIAASNVRLNPTQEKGVTNGALVAYAKAVCYRITDKLDRLPVDVANYMGTRNGVAGLYDLNLYAPANIAVKATVKVNVTTGAAPAITLTTPVVISLGTPMDYMNGVSAADAEDGDITGKVTFSPSVDTGKAGVYTVAYEVTDSDFNTVKAVRVVVVNDNTIKVGASYIVKAGNFVILSKDVSGTDAEILSKSGAMAWRKSDGALVTGQPTVISDGGYNSAEGDYPIEIGLAGDPSSLCSIIGKVVDANGLIVDDEYAIAANDVTMTLSEAQSGLAAAKLITLSGARAWKMSDFSAAKVLVGATNAVATAGNYSATYVVASKPAVSLTKDVQVTMGKAPTIDVTPNPHKVSVGSGLYPYTYGVTADDAEDGNITGKVTFTGTVDTSKPGVYQVTYSVTDKDGNVTTAARTVVVDDGHMVVTPKYILSASSFVVKGADVPSSTSSRLTQILSLSAAKAWRVDNGYAVQVDAAVMSAAGYSAKAGTYYITVAVDADRTVTRDIRANVVDDPILVKEGDYYIAGAPIKMNSVTDLTRPNLIALGNVRAYRSDDKLTPEPVRLDSYTGKFDGTAGTFMANFFVQADPASRLENLPVVVSNVSKPWLDVTTPVRIPVGGAWDPMAGVSAGDADDLAAGVPVNVNHSGKVDVNAEGLYKVTYSVTNSNYQTVAKSRVVAVGDFEISDGYILKADNFSESVMNIAGTKAELLSMSGAKAWDEDGNPVTAEVKLTGGYSKAGGLYTVTIGVAGKGGAPTKTIFANITADTYVVAFNGNGAAAQSGTTFVTVAQPATTVPTLPAAPTRPGYTFSGWNTEANGSGMNFTNATAVTSNQTLFAQWTVEKYRLSFSLNGGSGAAPAAQTLNYDALATAVSAPKPASKDVTFKGWNTAIDGSGTYWSFPSTRMPAKDVTLYAQWVQPNTVTVTNTVEKDVVKVVKVKKPVPGPTKTIVKPGKTVYTPGPTKTVVVPGPAQPAPAAPAPVAPPAPIIITQPAFQGAQPAGEIGEPASADVTSNVTNNDNSGLLNNPTNGADSPESDGWSLVDLLIAGLGFVMLVFGVIAMAMRKDDDQERERKHWARTAAGFTAAIVAAVANIVIFALEDFSGEMRISDKFTILMAIAFIVEVIGLTTVLMRAERDYEDMEKDVY